MRHVVMMLSMVCLALAGTASAAVEKEDVEIEVMGGWAMESANTESDITEALDGPDLDGWFVMGGLSRFISDHLQLGIAGFYTQMESDKETFVMDELSIEGEFEVDAWGIGGRAKYHFNPADQWVWYAGGQVFWVSADIDATASTIPPELAPSTSESDSANGILWGPILGLRIELGERNELLLEYQYHLWAGDIGDSVEDGHSVFVGISHRVK